MATKLITGTCEISTGAFTAGVSSPVYQWEDDATAISVELENGGVAYAPPAGSGAWMHFYYEGRGLQTQAVAMTIAGNTVSADIPVVLTAISGLVKCVIGITNNDSLIVACTFPLQVLPAVGNQVTSYLAPSDALYNEILSDVAGFAGLRASTSTFGLCKPDGVTLVATGGVLSVNITEIPYDEGAWTPVLSFGGATTGIEYTHQKGHYCRIGGIVHIGMEIQLSSKGTATGNATITGLPFVSKAGIGVYSNAADLFTRMSLPANAVGVCFDLTAASQTLIPRVSSLSTDYIILADTNFANNSMLRMSGVYFI